MKTKLSLSILMFAAFCSLTVAQVPQGFNYQAVARDPAGILLINRSMPVRITIQSDSLGTGIIWQELHSSAATNSLGLINLVLGKGARQSASTVSAFGAIDWSVTPKFIKTEIDYNGWKTMGVTRLWSVPYSVIAGDLAGSVKKLSVAGQTSVNDEALFEVRNKSGQLVFAVYNEGVRVYVSDGAKGLKGGFAVGGFGTDKAESQKYLVVSKDSTRIYIDNNPLTKKLKGGFAVGGYDLTKDLVQNYLDVNPDSIRIYIDTNPTTKKLKGGFAVGGYDMTKGSKVDYLNVAADETGIINPSQNRILWYPLKNAFLTGKVLITSPANVGVNSFATGFESRAKGMYSQAMGFKTIADGDYSTAIGKNAIASNNNSFAFGDSPQATSNDSYAFGAGARAQGTGSYAFGSAGRDASGNLTGIMTTASGTYSYAIGNGSYSSGIASFAIGSNATASGNFSLALGWYPKAQGNNSIAIGNATASNDYAFAMGGPYIVQLPSWVYQTQATGLYSIALGRGVTAKSLCMFAVGQLNEDFNGNPNQWVGTDQLFVVGNGYVYNLGGSPHVVQSNTLTILKNGDIGIGTSPTTKLDVNGNINATSLNGISFFIKYGNDGSVSGDTYCRGALWGRVGSCIGVKVASSGAYISIYAIANEAVYCLCAAF
jgi:hypothetical protein